LVDDGPDYSDLKMIQATAEVLDIFGDFQTAVSHYALPHEIKSSSSDLVSHATEVLLTLSPLKEVRRSATRRDQLEPLKHRLIVKVDDFNKLCSHFEHDPSKFPTSSGGPNLSLEPTHIGVPTLAASLQR